MLRNSALLLSRLTCLTLRAPLALPLLAANAFRLRSACPRSARGLHIFVRTTASNDDFSKVEVRDGADVGDLKKAVIAELKLDAAPDSVRLLREAEGGGAPVPLDSRMALAGQGVLAGSSVLVEVLPPPPPPLPPALPYVLVRRDGSLVPTKVAFAPGADADDLKDAVCAKLKLDAAPDSVRLLREVEGGGTLVPLDSLRELTEQGVLVGSSVVVEVIAPDAASPDEATALENARRLLSALHAAELERIPSSRSSLIRLPEGVLWPQLGAEPLFVRDFYAGLYEGVLGSCRAAKGRRFIIRGNAGIGKSAFGAYILWRAVKAGRTVVYTSDKVEFSFTLHSDGRVEVFDAGQLVQRAKGTLGDSSTVFICDGIKPVFASAFTVLITPPKRELYKEFFKLLDCQMLTVPVFFHREIKDMLHTCFPHLLPQERQVWELYDKWGGIVRYVLGKHDRESQLLLEDSLTAVSLEGLFFHLGARVIESDDNASHRLLHLKPAGVLEGADTFSNPYDASSYSLSHTVLASTFVKTRLLQCMQQRHFEHLNWVLAQPIATPSFARLYWELYEMGAIAKLLKGGEFDVFDCSTGTLVMGGLVVPPSEKVIFRDAGDLARVHASRQGLPALYVPGSSSYTAVDAVLPGNALVNFSIDVSHESGEGAAPVADALGVAGDIAFYWALPKEKFEKACKAGKPFPVAGQQLGRKRTLKQYFLCVPLTNVTM